MICVYLYTCLCTYLPMCLYVGLETRLTSPGFRDKAPAKVLAEVETLLADKREQVNAINKSLLELTSKQ